MSNTLSVFKGYALIILYKITTKKNVRQNTYFYQISENYIENANFGT